MKVDFSCKSINFSENNETGNSKSNINKGTESTFNDKLQNIDNKEISSKETSEENEDSDLNYSYLCYLLENIQSINNDSSNNSVIEFNVNEIKDFNDFIQTTELIKLTDQEKLNKLFDAIKSSLSNEELKKLTEQLDNIVGQGNDNKNSRGLIDLIGDKYDDSEIKKILELSLEKFNESTEDNNFGADSKEEDIFSELINFKKQTISMDKTSENESISVLERIANVNSKSKTLNGDLSLDVESKHNLNFSHNDDIEVRSISGEKITSYISSTNTQQDVIRAFKYIKFNGLEQMTIRLKPDELGEMNIKLSKQDGEMIGIITVTNKSVYELVNKSAVDLKQHLESLNINIKELNVNVSDQGSQQFDLSKKDFERESYQEGKQRQFNNNDKEEISPEVKIKTDEGTEDRLDVLA